MESGWSMALAHVALSRSSAGFDPSARHLHCRATGTPYNMSTAPIGFRPRISRPGKRQTGRSRRTGPSCPGITASSALCARHLDRDALTTVTLHGHHLLYPLRTTGKFTRPGNTVVLDQWRKVNMLWPTSSILADEHAFQTAPGSMVHTHLSAPRAPSQPLARRSDRVPDWRATGPDVEHGGSAPGPA